MNADKTIEKQEAERKRKETKIYRWHATTIDDFVPSDSDVKDTGGIPGPGLSFSLVPRKGIAMMETTIGDIEATGAFVAINDVRTHVSVYPYVPGKTREEVMRYWQEGGVGSPYTILLYSLSKPVPIT